MKNKKGTASFYIVIASVLLFGVIIVAFVSLIASESNKTTEDILAQSAYDAALAGIEDAKIAINTASEAELASIYASNDCDTIGKFLNRNGGEGGEVLVQEEYNEKGEDVVQAYTCVKLSRVLSDYRAMLSPTEPSRIIPLKSEADDDEIDHITIKWFSKGNLGTSAPKFVNVDSSGIYFDSINTSDAPTPPILSVQLFQLPEGGLNMDGSGYNPNDTKNDNSDRGLIWLVPVGPGNAKYNNIKNEANPFAKSNNHMDGKKNDPYTVECASGGATSEEFLCSVDLKLPKPIDKNGNTANRQENSAFIVLSIPYNQPVSDFQVMLKDKDDHTVNFIDTQIAIDSTGRASDMFSRVETRIEFLDTYFPYPTYAIEMFSPNGEALSKNFWASHNCWYTADDGKVKLCDGTDRDSHPASEGTLNSGEL